MFVMIQCLVNLRSDYLKSEMYVESLNARRYEDASHIGCPSVSYLCEGL